MPHNKLNLISKTKIFFLIIFGINTQLFADDSTKVGPLTPLNPNQMFLLESGVQNFATATSGISSMPIVTTKQCPPNFTPYVKFSLYGQQTQTPLNGICPSSISAGGGSYSISYLSTVLSSNGTVTGTSIAFNWDVYCLPGNIPTANNWVWNGTTGTSNNCQTLLDIKPSVAYNQTPIPWASGRVNRLASAPLIIPTLCPGGWNPFVAVGTSFVEFGWGSGDQYLKGFKICIDSVITLQNSYQVNYSDLSQNGSHNNYGGAGFNWTLYCFPPGMDTSQQIQCGWGDI